MDELKRFAINDYDFFISENEKKPVKQSLGLVSEYIEGKRVLPANTPFPGYWENSRTPYSVEIMDNMSPLSPIQQTVVMKGAQIGLTAAAENVIAYYIDEVPAEILFISATEQLLEKWATKRLDPLIDSCGFRHKIFAQTFSNKLSRRTGDRIFVKEYAGGNLDMASSRSAAGLRSDSKRILIRDEIDGSPLLLRTGEGNWLDVSFARTNAWGIRKKILDFSTPTTIETSAIYKEYLDGDQRHYFVPCPLCGKKQILVWGDEKSNHGIRGETKAGRLDKVFYLCEFCHDAFFNHHKGDIFNRGEWRPTKEAQFDYYRSYYISSLYSPPGMLSWFEMYEKYLKAQETPEGMRSFTNLYMGWVYKETGVKPQANKLMNLRGTYEIGTVPDGVLFLTMGVDVQSGSKKDKKNPARLELEVCGHGPGFRTYSITCKKFLGEVDDPFAGAWTSFAEWAAETRLQFERLDGFKFSVVLILIDSGDGNLADVVYRFCSGWKSTYPSKGEGLLQAQKKDKGDQLSALNFRKYRVSKVGGSDILYLISTNYYKTHLYNNLKIARKEDDLQKPGFCDFPQGYEIEYFKELTCEEKREDGSFHNPGRRRNEALDCRVLNQCACDIYLDSEVAKMKAAYQNRGYKKEQLQNINHRMVLDFLAKKVSK